MNTLELFLLDLGWSWTMSKAVPYLVMVAVGALLVSISRKWIVKKTFPSKVIIKLMLFIIPFATYFMCFPIYQGDFSNNSITVLKVRLKKNYKEKNSLY